MTVARSLHDDHGAVYERVGDPPASGAREVPAHYGRPAVAHRAVRNGVGVTEAPYGVLTIRGDDRVEYVDNVVSNRVPRADGQGCYALLLDPQGRVEADVYVFNAAERLLLFFPPGVERAVAADWREKVFVQDVTIEVATEDLGVFGVHGPSATEKVASVLHGASAPDGHLSFVRGSLGDAGATVIRSDDLPGEEGYEVVCDAAAAPEVFDTLLTRGLNAAPFGRETWRSLTLEAGTPLFDSELRGEIPNVTGTRNALDFEKGCYVGQEVVSRVENRGRPSRRLVGLRPDALPDAGAAVFEGDSAVGEVTRAVESPSLGEPVALAILEWDAASGADADERADGNAGEKAGENVDGDATAAEGDVPATALTVRVDGEQVAAEVADLPFVDGSGRSARRPTY